MAYRTSTGTRLSRVSVLKRERSERASICSQSSKTSFPVCSSPSPPLSPQWRPTSCETWYQRERRWKERDLCSRSSARSHSSSGVNSFLGKLRLSAPSSFGGSLIGSLHSAGWLGLAMPLISSACHSPSPISKLSSTAPPNLL